MEKVFQFILTFAVQNGFIYSIYFVPWNSNDKFMFYLWCYELGFKKILENEHINLFLKKILTSTNKIAKSVYKPVSTNHLNPVVTTNL